MSKLGKFFKGAGSSKSRAAPSPQEALARLRETEEMLGKKQEYLESRIQRELSLARKHGTQNKRGRLGLRRAPALRSDLQPFAGQPASAASTCPPAPRGVPIPFWELALTPRAGPAAS